MDYLPGRLPALQDDRSIQGVDPYVCIYMNRCADVSNRYFVELVITDARKVMVVWVGEVDLPDPSRNRG